jgi:hypothetical protein
MDNYIIKADNGPIIVIIKKLTDVNKDNFIIDNSNNLLHKKYNTDIITNSYIKVLIRSVKIMKNDKIIFSIGYILDIASPDDVKKYYDVLKSKYE